PVRCAPPASVVGAGRGGPGRRRRPAGPPPPRPSSRSGRMAPVHDLHVNGRHHRVEADPAKSLLAVLREDLDLTGAKYGCGEGQCGAGTVLVDGRAERSSITPVGSVGARPVITIERLDRGDALHPIQQAVLDEGALQCGYCTPGMIMAALDLLGRTSSPAGDEVHRALEGNVCRCGTYSRIVRAVLRAAGTTAEASNG